MAFGLDRSKSPYGVNTPKIKFLKFQAEVLLISEVSVFIYGSMSGQKQCLLTLLPLLFYLRSETTCTVFYIVWADNLAVGFPGVEKIFYFLGPEENIRKFSASNRQFDTALLLLLYCNCVTLTSC